MPPRIIRYHVSPAKSLLSVAYWVRLAMSIAVDDLAPAMNKPIAGGMFSHFSAARIQS